MGVLSPGPREDEPGSGHPFGTPILLAILGGALLMTLLAMSGGVLLILVIGKTLLDARLHKRSHQRLAASP